jgi:hypothetical protein
MLFWERAVEQNGFLTEMGAFANRTHLFQRPDFEGRGKMPIEPQPVAAFW